MEDITVAMVLYKPDEIRMFQLLQWKYALKLEIKGMRHSQGSVYAHVKRQLGLRGNRAKVLAQLESIIEEGMKDR